MLSYLIVKVRLKNFRIDSARTKKLTEMKTNRWTQKHKKSLKTNTVVNAGPPRYRVSVFSLNVEGVTEKGSLLPLM